jgi:hypothetical protein
MLVADEYRQSDNADDENYPKSQLTPMRHPRPFYARPARLHGSAYHIEFQDARRSADV